MIMLGNDLGSNEERVFNDIASIAEVRGRGGFANLRDQFAEKDWEDIEVLLLNSMSPDGVEDTVKKCKNLRWIHSVTAGINQLTNPTVKGLDIPVTNAKGVYSHSLAEYALFGCNYFAKNYPRLAASKAEKKWDVFTVEDLRGRTMGVIGLGDIGMATAKIAKAFKMNIIGVRRNLRLTEEEKQTIDAVYGQEDLEKVMAMSDYVVAALPLTQKTKEMITADAINAMQPHAVFVNIGRGKTVDEPALIKALQEGRLKGSVLDVYYDEPLSPDSPFWEMDNVLMSFHNADETDHAVADSLSLFKELLTDYIEGRELRNLVDVMEGY